MTTTTERVDRRGRRIPDGFAPRSRHLPTLVEILHGRSSISYLELKTELGRRVPPGAAIRRTERRRESQRALYRENNPVALRPRGYKRSNAYDPIDAGRLQIGRERIQTFLSAEYLTKDEDNVLHTTDKYDTVTRELGLR